MGNSNLASQFVSAPAASACRGAFGTPMDFTTQKPCSWTKEKKSAWCAEDLFSEQSSARPARVPGCILSGGLGTPSVVMGRVARNARPRKTS